jgi:putative phosphoesterase
LESTDGSELHVGIIADSHDCLPRIKDVIGRLNSEPIELVLHAGDYSAPFVTDYYRALKVHMIGVFGNNDAEKGKLRDRFAEAGHEIKGRFAEVQAGNLRIALTHGDEDELLRSLTTCRGYDVVVYGHTHQAEVVEEERALVINPGEICGYLTGKSTFAILDTSERKARLCSF